MRWQILFDVKKFNGGPKIRLWWQDKIILDKEFHTEGEQFLDFETNNKLPNILCIEHYGKNMRKDTLVENQIIKRDKALIIKELHINQVKLKYEIFLFNFITEGKKELTNLNYLGFNGKFMINIDNDNINSWFFDIHNKLYQSEKFNYENFKKEIFSL